MVTARKAGKDYYQGNAKASGRSVALHIVSKDKNAGQVRATRRHAQEHNQRELGIWEDAVREFQVVGRQLIARGSHKVFNN